MAITRKLQRTNKDQYTITLPKALVDLLGLKEQDVLEFSLENDKIVLNKHKRGGDKR